MKRHQTSQITTRRLIIFVVIVACGAFVLLGAHFVSALDVDVTAVVPTQPPEPDEDATVQFSGFAYPNSVVTITRNGTSYASGTADAQAAFSFNITTPPGSYTFGVYGTDTNSVQGALAQFSLTLTAGSTTTLSNIFLGPTISGSASTITRLETIIFSGTTIPNATVRLTVASDPVIYTTSSNGSGFWSYTVNGATLSSGNHTGQAQTTAPSSTLSEQSTVITFSVTPSQDPASCVGKPDADINCDGFVDLVDFSIMLFYWNQTDPANSRADINNDTLVNETDFSIMLFFWTG